MRAFLSCLAGILLWSACGGSPAEPQAQSAADDQASTAKERRATSSAASDVETNAAAQRSASGNPSCDDGTCSLCGSGICPSGWYCDEKGGACSWLAECAEKPSCGCVTRVLGPSCKCEVSGGGLKVACD